MKWPADSAERALNLLLFKCSALLTELFPPRTKSNQWKILINQCVNDFRGNLVACDRNTKNVAKNHCFIWKSNGNIQPIDIALLASSSRRSAFPNISTLLSHIFHKCLSTRPYQTNQLSVNYFVSSWKRFLLFCAAYFSTFHELYRWWCFYSFFNKIGKCFSDFIPNSFTIKDGIILFLKNTARSIHFNQNTSFHTLQIHPQETFFLWLLMMMAPPVSTGGATGEIPPENKFDKNQERSIWHFVLQLHIPWIIKKYLINDHNGTGSTSKVNVWPSGHGCKYRPHLSFRIKFIFIRFSGYLVSYKSLNFGQEFHQFFGSSN